MRLGMQGPVALFAFLGSALFANFAQAQNANLYVAHAAPGRTISSTTNPEFPVDVSVDGNCIATGVGFGEIRGGPFSGPAATYGINFTLGNTAFPCTGPSVFSSAITLAPGATYVSVLTLDASNHVIGQLYTLDLSPISPGSGRIEVINATQEILVGTLSSGTGTAVAGVNPASVLEATASAGLYTSTITPQGSSEVLVGPVNVGIQQRNLYLYVLAGSTTNQSVQFIGPKVIRGVF